MSDNANYATFDRASAGYDNVTAQHRHIAERLAELALPSPSSHLRAVDIGCGSGAVGAALARRQIIPAASVDFSQKMCAKIQRSVRADMAALPFADAAFDLAACSMALHWRPPFVDTLREIRRVLHPGGLWACAVPIEGSLEHYFALTKAAFPRAPVFTFPNTETLRRAERDAGFTLKEERIEIFSALVDAKTMLNAPRGAGGSARGGGPYPGKHAPQRFRALYETLPPEQRAITWRIRLCVCTA